MLAVKCVVVGDDAVGKTSLLISYVHNAFPDTYVPTIIDWYSTNYIFHDKTLKLHLFDTGGRESYDCLRPLSYSDTDVFLVCFSIVNPDSYAHVREKWFPEICLLHPNTRIILVGTMMDLRTDKETVKELRRKRMSPITMAQGMKMGKDINAVKYVECSAASQKGVKRIFEEVIRAMLVANVPIKKRRICSIS